MIGEDAPHHGAGTHHDVPAQLGARQDDDAGTEPAPGPDVHRHVGRPLGVHHLVGVLIAVVLVGDVHVRSGVHVVTDLQVEMTDDVTAAADHAAVTDPHHRVGDHALARDHAGRDAHVGSDQRVAPDPDPLLPEDGPGRERQAAPVAERTEPVGHHVAGTNGPVAVHPVPAGVDGRVDQAVAAESAPGRHAPRARETIDDGGERPGPIVRS